MDHLRGSCLCQTVSFEVSGDVQAFYLCHCSRCRKVSGSAHQSNIFLKVESFRWLSGEETVRRFALSETRFAKSFCPHCSAALPTLGGNGYALVPAGSLDTEFSRKPMAHIACSSRAKWDDGFHDLPQMPGMPGQ